MHYQDKLPAPQHESSAPAIGSVSSSPAASEVVSQGSLSLPSLSINQTIPQRQSDELDLRPNSDLQSPETMEEFVQMMKARKAQMSSICKDMKRNPSERLTFNYNHLYV